MVGFHCRCPDGILAALFIAEECLKRGRRPPTLIPLINNPARKLPRLAGEKVMFVDVVLSSAELVQAWELTGGHVLVFEHHDASAVTLTSGVLPSPNIFFSTGCCAAMLVWRWLHGDAETPAILDYVDDLDTFNFRAPQSREVSVIIKAKIAACKTKAEYFTVMKGWLMGGAVSLRALRAKVTTVWPFAQELVAPYVATAAEVRLPGFPDLSVGSAQGPPAALLSEVGNALAKRFDVAALWSYNVHTRVLRVSLYSDGDNTGAPDVNAIAGRFGGEGHKHAASFTSLGTPADVLVSYTGR